ncbi:MAG: Ig-like domain-containing protein [Alphaproteobacteria bacterium]
MLGLLGATPARGAVLRSIFVSPVSATLSIASTRQFKAYANFSDGSIVDVTTSAEWSTSSTRVAVVRTTMPGRGTVTATGPGSARISAALVEEDGSKTKGSADLVVPVPPLRAITTKPTTKRIEVGLDSAFRAIADRGNGIADDVTTAVTWVSTNPSVATVQATGPQAGLVHPVAPGNTTIVARDKATGIANTDGATEVRARAVSLSVEPSTVVLPKRLAFPMRCYVNRADGSRSNVTDDV